MSANDPSAPKHDNNSSSCKCKVNDTLMSDDTTPNYVLPSNSEASTSRKHVLPPTATYQNCDIDAQISNTPNFLMSATCNSPISQSGMNLKKFMNSCYNSLAPITSNTEIICYTAQVEEIKSAASNGPTEVSVKEQETESHAEANDQSLSCNSAQKFSESLTSQSKSDISEEDQNCSQNTSSSDDSEYSYILQLQKSFSDDAKANRSLKAELEISDRNNSDDRNENMEGKGKSSIETENDEKTVSVAVTDDNYTLARDIEILKDEPSNIVVNPDESSITNNDTSFSLTTLIRYAKRLSLFGVRRHSNENLHVETPRSSKARFDDEMTLDLEWDDDACKTSSNCETLLINILESDNCSTPKNKVSTSKIINHVAQLDETENVDSNADTAIPPKEKENVSPVQSFLQSTTDRNQILNPSSSRDTEISINNELQETSPDDMDLKISKSKHIPDITITESVTCNGDTSGEYINENLLSINYNKLFTPNKLKRSSSWSSKNSDLLKHVLIKNLSDKQRQRHYSESDATKHVINDSKPFCKTVQDSGLHDMGTDFQQDYVFISNNFITQYTLLASMNI